ncbi:sensor histidine kinase [Acetobacter orleanensis]|uniref:histidine kinase n=1 Tax=Acetobacter orleanensis TaxID=104099 RepID=A0A4Y3TKK9_9PROT|nr:ATP-binding protein [Acetobacter orleanensis]KXV62603.1 histidine kinase [Acetobacter orleanensis]PCD79947.1 two-component sensor histidine kinase [Acetobacter orleanensis]GAN68251.1 two component sensor histidine kinase [Acetobacter orleanensis JCM 7639]GBR31242.1 two component sensor histidine kinase [Acetobacter orleanensis NRIC 0473]GEB82856.1 two-component sensor histidine kinase [Acetobacter orleanensis]
MTAPATTVTASPQPGFLRLRSVSLRFALVYGTLFVCSAILFLSFIWWGTEGLLEHRVERAITTDSRTLYNIWAESGPAGLTLVIDDRLEQDVDDNTLYLLINKDQKWVAGNLSEWPRQVTSDHHWFTLPVQRAYTQDMAKVRAYLLPDGYRLLIGRDISGRTLLRKMLTDMLLWACIMITLLAVGGGWLVRRLFRHVIHTISRTTLAITHGDMSRRMPVQGTDDELDEIAITINEMLDRISRLMDGVRQVSNAIAHDLRTPITRARAQLEDAALHATNETELRAAMEQAASNLDNVTSICEALLRIAQIESGARRSAFVLFDLIPALQDVCELYEAVAEEHGLIFVRQLPEHLPFFGDRAMFQQAVANLLDNAVKFSPSNGAVTLSAKVLPAARRSDGSRGALLRLCVADVGIGMNEADMARASERFFRAEQARNTPGSGLGLSLVQAIVQLHEGQLHLSSNNPGLITCIEIPLPEANALLLADSMPNNH